MATSRSFPALPPAISSTCTRLNTWPGAISRRAVPSRSRSIALRPGPLDPGAHQVTLDFGGITTSWTQTGPTSVALLDWPFPTGVNDVHVVFDPPSDGPELQQSGPWALFRLLKEARLDRSGNGNTVTLQQGERQARFDLPLAAGTARSPFDPELLASFKCPVLRP